MGIRGSFRIVPAPAFAGRVDPDGIRVPADGPWFDIDKAWFELHVVFRSLPEPLCFAIQGDFSNESLEGALIRGPGEEGDEGGGTYLGYVTPATASRLAQALAAFPRWKLFEDLRRQFPSLLKQKERRDYFAWVYDELQKAYAAAAEQGAGLQVLIC
jgi:hypothetical protein